MNRKDVVQRAYTDGDGTCFASVALNEGCSILSAIADSCGTYRCPFYKPEGCKGWIRLNAKEGVVLIPPEDYYTK